MPLRPYVLTRAESYIIALASNVFHGYTPSTRRMKDIVRNLECRGMLECCTNGAYVITPLGTAMWYLDLEVSHCSVENVKT